MTGGGLDMTGVSPTIADLDLPSIGYATAAALLFAVANNLQRDAASIVPLEVGGPVRLVLHLLRAPRWLLGSLLALVALALHAVALARGGVILVQALLAGGLIAALALEAAGERRWMRHREVSGSLLLVAGVVLLLGWGRPAGGEPVDLQVQLTVALALAVVAAIGLTGSRLHSRVKTSAVLMGACAGACFALDAVFLKGMANSADGDEPLPAAINLVGFVVASVLGNLIVQRAYQRAPLRLVLPAVTAGDPLAAFALGRWVLHETLQGGAGSSMAIGIGLLAIALGIVITTTGSAVETTIEVPPPGGSQRGSPPAPHSGPADDPHSGPALRRQGDPADDGLTTLTVDLLRDPTGHSAAVRP